MDLPAVEKKIKIWADLLEKTSVLLRIWGIFFGVFLGQGRKFLSSTRPNFKDCPIRLPLFPSVSVSFWQH